MDITTHRARITGPVPDRAGSGRPQNTPIGPCPVEHLGGRPIDIIRGKRGQCAVALPIAELEAARAQGHLVLLDGGRRRAAAMTARCRAVGEPGIHRVATGWACGSGLRERPALLHPALGSAGVRPATPSPSTSRRLRSRCANTGAIRASACSQAMRGANPATRQRRPMAAGARENQAPMVLQPRPPGSDSAMRQFAGSQPLVTAKWQVQKCPIICKSPECALTSCAGAHRCW